MTEKSLKIKDQIRKVRDRSNVFKSELAAIENDPYYTESKLARYEQRIREARDILARNKELFFEFIKWLKSDATAVRSDTRLLKYYWHFWRVLRLCTKDMDRMTRQDVQGLLETIKTMRVTGDKRYSEATYADFQRLIKIFWKWMKGGGENFPEEVKWVKVIEPKSKVKAENIPTEAEIYRMRDAVNNIRDKALIMVMKESGWRIGEHLDTKLKNVSFTNDGIEISVISPKTGELLWTLLIESVPWLQLWFENHPDRHNPEAYLWMTNFNSKPRRMNHSTVLRILKVASKRAGITKRIHPHIFRDYRVKELLLGKPDKGISPLHPETVRRMMGWRSLSMLERYGQFMNSDLREIYLRFSGKKQVEVKPAGPPTKLCPICSFENPAETKRCMKCARPVDLTAALEDEQKRREEIRKMIEQFLKQAGIQATPLVL